MKKTLALASVLAFLCMPTPASDKDKKDEKKPVAQPIRVMLTPAQNKALDELDHQFRRLEEEAQKQAQILSARESGLVSAFVMGTKLEGKQYKLVKDNDGYVVEEMVPPAPEPLPPGPAPQDPQPNSAAQNPASDHSSPKKQQ